MITKLRLDVWSETCSLFTDTKQLQQTQMNGDGFAGVGLPATGNNILLFESSVRTQMENG